MGPILYRWGAVCARHARVVLAVWVVLLVGLLGTAAQAGHVTDNTVTLPGTDSQQAFDLLAAEFPPQQNGSSPLVFHAPTGKVTDAERQAAIQDAVQAVTKAPLVAGATDPFANSAAGLVAEEGTTAFAPVLLEVSASDLTEEAAQTVLDAAAPVTAAGLTVDAGGAIGSALAPADTGSSELIGMLAAMVILAITFGSLVAMGLPLLTAVLGLAAGLSTVGLVGHVLQVPTVGPTLATMIGLGVGIDYALFLVNRHRTLLAEGLEVHESVARTVATSGGAVVFAGGTVVIALLSLAVAGIPFITSLGIASAVAVLTAVLAAMTLLPAVLSLLGHRVHRLRLPLVGRSSKPARATAWGRLAHAVTARPVLTMAVALLLLLPLILPVASLTLGQEDVGAEPVATTERRAFDLIEAGFGPGYNGVLVVANEVSPAAQPSATYTSQYDQATAMKKDLTNKQQELTEEADRLSAEQAELTGEQSTLLAEQASLEQQESALRAQQAELERRAARLQRERDAMRRQAERLRTRAAALRDDVRAQRLDLRAERRALAENLARQAAVRRGLEAAEGDPVITERLQRDLAELQSEAVGLRAARDATRADLQADARQARKLATDARRLVRQAERLVRQARALRADAERLEAQAASLQAQAAALTTQGQELEAAAASLTAQGDELKDEKKSAQAEQKQAEQLQSELTDELTRAGGDPRGTDPRLVAEQDALDGLGTAGGVQVVGPPIINESGDAAYFSVVPTTRPADPATASLVRHLRADVLPPVTSANDLVAHVGGTTATNVDLAALISERLPLVIVTVLALSFVLLMIAFGSLLIPLQAALTNLLTVAAAFGVLTACFQWGWGIDLVGLDTAAGTVPIASFVPLMMFAALFGLSMDYEVFLVSQVQHAHLQGASPRAAVRQGLGSAAKVIAAAALIMISVFGSFVLVGDPTVKQFGVGLSVAVLLAGLMVLTFAPAMLVLFGRRAFWLPDRLARVLPEMNVEGEDR